MVMIVGTTDTEVDAETVMSVVTPGLDLLSYHYTDTMEVLGSMVDRTDRTIVMAEHRVRKVEGNFWANSKLLKGPASMGTKVAAWVRAPAASAIFECGIWIMTKTLLIKPSGWERKWLRRALRWKPRPGEAWQT